MDYRLITERCHLYCPNDQVCFAAVLDAPVDLAALRAAVGGAVKRHPVLKGCVRMDGARAYLHIGDGVAPEVSEEPDTDWRQAVLRAQETPFKLGEAPLFRVALLNDAAEGPVLLLRFHHILADGLSGIKLLRDILLFIKNPAADDTPAIDPLLEDRALYPGEGLSLPLRLLVSRWNRAWRRSPHVFTGEDYRRLLETYGRRVRRGLMSAALESPETQRLTALCREHGVTVNSLLITTLLKAVREETGQGKKIGLAAGLHPDDHCIGNYASGISVEYVYNSARGLWENAREVHRRIQKKLKDDRRKTFFLTFMKALEPGLVDGMYFAQFGLCENKAARTLGKLLGYTETLAGCGITNLARAEFPPGLGVKRLYFTPPLAPNLDRIAGAVSAGVSATSGGTATSGGVLTLVWQYDTRSKDASERIFRRWTAALEGISQASKKA